MTDTLAPHFPGLAQIEPHRTLVLFGAAISLAPPSSQPSPSKLVQDTYLSVADALLSRVPSHLIRRMTTPPTLRAIANLRLELALEYVARELGVATAVTAYDCLASRPPNQNHFLLAVLARRGYQLVTTNQDVLVETAGRSAGGSEPDVLHLHGRVDEPRTIRTTLSQLTQGLPSPVARRFEDRLANRTLIAIGYSGRDEDVLATIRRTAVQRVIWLSRDGSTYREVERLAPTIWRGDLTRALARLVGTRSRHNPPVAPSSAPPRPHPCGLHWMGEVAPIRLVATASRFLDPHGRAAVTLDLLRCVRDDLDEPGLKEFTRGKSLLRSGEGRRAMKSFKLARTAFDRAANERGVRDALNWQANTARIQGRIKTMVEVVAELEDLGPVPRNKEANEALAWALTHRAGAYRLAGLFDKAHRDYANARTLFTRHRSSSGLVHCLTWNAEAYRGQGFLERASRMTLRAMDLAEDFESPDVRAWPTWNLGEIRKLQGRPDEAIALYRTALQLFRSNRNASAVNWCMTSWADAARLPSPAQARKMNDRAMALARGDFAIATCWLNEGERLRTAGRLGEAILAFKHALHVSSERQLTRAPGRMGLQAQLAILEARRANGRARVSDYDDLVDRADAVGFHWLRMRSSLSRYFAKWQEENAEPRQELHHVKALISKFGSALDDRILSDGRRRGSSAILPLVFN